MSSSYDGLVRTFRTAGAGVPVRRGERLDLRRKPVAGTGSPEGAEAPVLGRLREEMAELGRP